MSLVAPTEPQTASPPRRFDWRLALSVPLLGVAALLTWSTVQGLEGRRKLRTELAEISHVRYGLLNANRWVEILVPLLDARIDALDLAPAQGASLRPMVQSALNRLLDDVKAQMSVKPAAPPGGAAPAAGGFLGQGNPLIVNMIIGALRPHIPEYTTMVLRELGRPQSREAVKNYIHSALAEGAKTTFGAVDMRWYSSILKQHGCADAETCKQTLGGEIRDADARIQRDYLGALAACAAAFFVLLTRRGPLGRWSIVVLLLFSLVLLAGGLATPMLEVEAKISQLKVTLLGTPVVFSDQVLYYQSKSVFEVFRALIDTNRPEMWVVGVLVLMFSVVFPALKLIASAAALFRPGLVRNAVVRFFALESSKWSMADVMALAIFMAFVAFNGLVGHTLESLRQTGAEVLIPTNSSKILPGYYLFIGFCLASLFVARRLGKQLRGRSEA